MSVAQHSFPVATDALHEIVQRTDPDHVSVGEFDLPRLLGERGELHVRDRIPTLGICRGRMHVERLCAGAKAAASDAAYPRLKVIAIDRDRRQRSRHRVRIDL